MSKSIANNLSLELKELTVVGTVTNRLTITELCAWSLSWMLKSLY